MKPNKYGNVAPPQRYETNGSIGTQGKECRLANFLKCISHNCET